METFKKCEQISKVTVFTRENHTSHARKDFAVLSFIHPCMYVCKVRRNLSEHVQYQMWSSTITGEPGQLFHATHPGGDVDKTRNPPHGREIWEFQLLGPRVFS